MGDNIVPTITLAKIYEAQNELVDAVNVYAMLKTKEPSEEIERKIEQLTDIIFENITRDYDDRISRLFSQSELRHFRIIPGDTVQISSNESSQAGSRLEIDPEFEPDSDIENDPDEMLTDEEEIYDGITTKELEEIEKILNNQLLVTETGEKGDELNEEVSLQEEKAKLLKKIELIEQKLHQLKLAQSEINSASNTHNGASELEIPENNDDLNKLDFKRYNQVKIEPEIIPRSDSESEHNRDLE